MFDLEVVVKSAGGTYTYVVKFYGTFMLDKVPQCSR